MTLSSIPISYLLKLYAKYSDLNYNLFDSLSWLRYFKSLQLERQTPIVMLMQTDEEDN